MRVGRLHSVLLPVIRWYFVTSAPLSRGAQRGNPLAGGYRLALLLCPPAVSAVVSGADTLDTRELARVARELRAVRRVVAEAVALVPVRELPRLRWLLRMRLAGGRVRQRHVPARLAVPKQGDVALRLRLGGGVPLELVLLRAAVVAVPLGLPVLPVVLPVLVVPTVLAVPVVLIRVILTLAV